MSTPRFHPGHLLRRAALGIGTAALLVTLSACEEDVVAVTGTDLPYSLYGVISPQLDSQWVRVYPIEGRLTPAQAQPLDAVVTSTDLATGEVREWRDSVIVDFADQYAHVFWAPFQAEYGHAYRIEALRSDGEKTFVTAAVPIRSEVDLREPQVRSDGVILPVVVPGGVPRVLAVEVEYNVAYRPITEPDIESAQLVIPYYTEARNTEEGWLVPINLRNDYHTVIASLQEDAEEPLDARVGIILLNITLRLIVGSEEWDPPFGKFDAELMVQPGVMQNVESGFGFVGAGYQLIHQWLPPQDAIVLSGFRAPEES